MSTNRAPIADEKNQSIQRVTPQSNNRQSVWAYRTCPAFNATHQPSQDTHLTLGDLHGNAFKLIHFLLHNDVLRLNEPTNDYKELLRIYHSFGRYASFIDNKAQFNEDLARFNQILEETTLNPIDTLTLIGDDLCDRGSCDLLTLLVIKQLQTKENKPKHLHILLSNHSLEFIKQAEKEHPEKEQAFIPSMLLPKHSNSMRTLDMFIKKGFISRQEIIDLYQRNYKQSIRILDYRLCTHPDGRIGITLFSHAPISVAIIAVLAKKLNIEYKDQTPIDLAETIDLINQTLTRDYVATNKAHTLFDDIIIKNGYKEKKINPKSHPFEYLIWNRDNTINRDDEHNDYPVFYVHGHDPEPYPSNIKHIYNLDYNNTFGKDPGSDNNPYSMLYSNTPRIESSIKLRHDASTQIDAYRKSQGFFGPAKKRFTRFTDDHPVLWKMIKWVVIPAALAAAITFTGGLAAIGFVAAKAVCFLVSTAILSITGNAALALLPFGSSKCPSITKTSSPTSTTDKSKRPLLPVKQSTSSALKSMGLIIPPSSDPFAMDIAASPATTYAPIELDLSDSRQQSHHLLQSTRPQQPSTTDEPSNADVKNAHEELLRLGF